jgi:hypothetical protein
MIHVAERIAEIVVDRLAIFGPIGGVVRPTRLADHEIKDYQIVLTQGNKSPVDEFSCPGNPPLIAYELPFEIACILRPSEMEIQSADTLRNQFELDVIQSLTLASDWWTWNGLAIDSKISSIAPYQANDGSSSGFQLTLTVTYRVAENNPSVVQP